MSTNTTISFFKKTKTKTKKHKNSGPYFPLHLPFHYSAPIYSKTLLKNCLPSHLFPTAQFILKNFKPTRMLK